ncbi:MAG: hypothetical protein VX672_05195 [Planctomycetota bacterium]|nr:hypothetical protein [Planctomycetota bacterium]
MSDSEPTSEQALAAAAGHSDLRASLLVASRAALRHSAIWIRGGVEIRVVENTPEIPHLTLLPASSPADSDEQLEAARGGSTDAGFEACIPDTQSHFLPRCEVG